MKSKAKSPQPEVRQYLAHYARSFIKPILGLFVIYFFSWAAGIVTPKISGLFIDRILIGKDASAILPYTSLLSAMLLFELVIGFLSGHTMASLKSRMAFSMNFDVLEHMKRLPYLYLKNTDATYLSNRVNSDTNDLTSFLIETILGLSLNLLSIVIISLLLFRINSAIALLMACLVPAYWLLYKLFQKPLYKSVLASKEVQNKFFSTMNSQLRDIKLHKLNAWYNTIADQLKFRFNSVYNTSMSMIRMGLLYSSASQIITRLPSIALFMLGGREVIKGTMTVGDFTIMNIYFSMLFNASAYFIQLGRTIESTRASWHRVQEILSREQEFRGQETLEIIESIECRNLSFSYEGETKPTIDNLSCTFTKGKIWAVSGANGSGKTTFINLLSGIIDEYSGSITYNGKDIRGLDTVDSRRRLLGIQEQEPMLLDEGIYENICFGIENPDRELLSELARYFDIENLVHDKDLPKKNEDTWNASISVSGGEKQKIALVRTLMKRPSVLFLDEPSSALDAHGVEALLRALNHIKEEAIIIVITHDERLCQKCDARILLNPVA